MGGCEDVLGTNQRSTAPELGPLRAVQKDGCQPGPLPSVGLYSTNNPARGVLLLATVLGIDYVVQLVV